MLDIDDIIYPEEWADLPDNDIEALAILLRKSRPRFHQILSSLPDEDQFHYSYEYMTAIYGIATARNVDFFTKKNLVYFNDFDSQVMIDFESDITMFIAQSMALKSKEISKNTVKLDNVSTSFLIEKAEKLRDFVLKSDIPERNKKKIIDLISRINSQLTTRRVSFVDIALLSAQLAVFPGGVAGTAQLLGFDMHEEIVKPMLERLHEQEEQISTQVLLKPEERKLIEHFPSSDDHKQIV